MSRSDSPVVAVLMTAPDAAVAERIAGTLVEERLAACVNVVEGVTSLYRWEGVVERESEVLVIVKTTAAEVDALRRRAVDLHPYDVPEVIELAVSSGHEPYLDWVRREVGAAS